MLKESQYLVGIIAVICMLTSDAYSPDYSAQPILSGVPHKGIIALGSGPKEALSIGSGPKSEKLSIGSGPKSEKLSIGSGSKSEKLSIGSGSKSEKLSIGSGLKSEKLSIGSGLKSKGQSLGLSSKAVQPLGLDPKEASMPKTIESPDREDNLSIKGEYDDVSASSISLPRSVYPQYLDPWLWGYILPIKKQENISKINSQSINLLLKESTMPILEPVLDEVYPDLKAAREFDMIFSDTDYYKSSDFRLTSNFEDIIRLMGQGFINQTLDPKTLTIDPQCGERSAFTERLLERHGISASIITAENFYGYMKGHAWVKVTTPQNETLYIDPTCGSGYFRRESKYEPTWKNGTLKEGYNISNDIFEVRNRYGDRGLAYFDWWCTDWGKLHL